MLAVCWLCSVEMAYILIGPICDAVANDKEKRGSFHHYT